MKNSVLLGLLGATVIGGASFLFISQEESEVSISTQGVNETLTYVPSDTILFTGGLTPTNMQEMVDSFSEQNKMMLAGVPWQEMLQKFKEKNQAPAAARMLIGLFAEYMVTFEEPSDFIQNLGLPNEVHSAIYMVGAIPVLRIKLADEAAFNAFLDRAESAGEVNAKIEHLEGVEFRSYSFDAADASSPTNIQLIAAIHEGHAILTLDTPLEREQLLTELLGIKKPQQSLADVDHLQKIVTQHGVLPFSIGFLNHQEIMRGFTQKEGNRFGHMLDLINQLANNKKPAAEQSTDPFAQIRTASCQKELMALATRWPQTIFGYSRFDVSNRPMQMHQLLVIESNDKTLLADLQTLRGYIPPYLRGEGESPVFGLGFGFNIDAVTPFVTKLWNEFQQKSYQCEPLEELRSNFVTNNPAAAMTMASAMARGIQGLSIALMDIDATITPDTPIPEVKLLDAIITLSANDPNTLLTMMASMAPPPFNSLVIPTDGTPVDIPLPLPFSNGDVAKLALKGSHIVAYIGKKSAAIADQLQHEPITSNSLMSMAIDYKKYFSLIADNLQAVAAESAEAQKAFSSMATLKALDMTMNASYDINDKGIIFDAKITMH